MSFATAAPTGNQLIGRYERHSTTSTVAPTQASHDASEEVCGGPRYDWHQLQRNQSAAGEKVGEEENTALCHHKESKGWQKRLGPEGSQFQENQANC